MKNSSINPNTRSNGLYNFIRTNLPVQCDENKNYLLVKPPTEANIVRCLTDLGDVDMDCHLRIDENFVDGCDNPDTLGRKWAHLSPAHYTERYSKDGAETAVVHVYFGLNGEVLKVSSYRFTAESPVNIELTKDHYQNMKAAILWSQDKLHSFREQRDNKVNDLQVQLSKIEDEFNQYADKNTRIKTFKKMYALSQKCDLYCGIVASVYTKSLKKVIEQSTMNTTGVSDNTSSLFACDENIEDDEQTEDIERSDQKSTVTLPCPVITEMQEILKALEQPLNIVEVYEQQLRVFVLYCDSKSALEKDQDVFKAAELIYKNFKSIDCQIIDVLLSGNISDLNAVCSYYSNQISYRILSKFSDLPKYIEKNKDSDFNLSRSIEYIIKEVGISAELLDAAYVGLRCRSRSGNAADSQMMVSLKEYLLHIRFLETFKVFQKYYPLNSIRMINSTDRSVLIMLSDVVKDIGLAKFYIDSGGPLTSYADDRPQQIFAYNLEELLGNKISYASDISDLLGKTGGPTHFDSLMYLLYANKLVPKEEELSFLIHCAKKMSMVENLINFAQLSNQLFINTIYGISQFPTVTAGKDHQSVAESCMTETGQFSHQTNMKFMCMGFYVKEENKKATEYDWENILLEYLNYMVANSKNILSVVEFLNKGPNSFSESHRPLNLVKARLIGIHIYTADLINKNESLTLNQRVDLSKMSIQATNKNNLKQENDDRNTQLLSRVLNLRTQLVDDYRDLLKQLVVDNRSDNIVQNR